ncbi:MAG: hydroxyethylthiazole kinase [Bacillus thermozeamaize]|uniref:Hydroxyethylthiazole kinase n=1 Tax=Bacillus thermozeamaize TaxID=230954 RepID=A0A1Y3PH51_9BACI|nr:MAG: hydroxyethylthiazole kinase [Bacillus thermozeamaize]
MENGFGKRVAELRNKVREQVPLIQHITNVVVTNFTANGTLAMGASPVMAYAHEEVEEMVRLANALVLNIGTLTADEVEAMVLAGREANRRGIPVLLDPVGAGTTRYRLEAAKRILEQVSITTVRGNAAEVAALTGLAWESRGVDSVGEHGNRIQLAKDAFKMLGITVAVTGPVDVVAGKSGVLTVENGVPMLGLVTGTGCLATGAVAAFTAVEQDEVLAAASALAYYGLAAEVAVARAQGPGSFQMAFLDELYRLSDQELKEGVRITAVEWR